LDNEALAALRTVASAVTLAVPVFPWRAATLNLRAVIDVLNWSAEACTLVASESLSLPGGTAVIAVTRALADVLTVVICADIAALTLLPSDVTTEASPWTFFLRVVVAVHTAPAHAVCSAVGAVLLVAADDAGGEAAVDVFAVVDVDPPHPARRAAAAIRTIDFLMGDFPFARVTLPRSHHFSPTRRAARPFSSAWTHPAHGASR